MKTRQPKAVVKIPKTGDFYDRGYFAARHWQPIMDGAWVHVHVRGHAKRRACVHIRDFVRLTRRDPNGPFLERWGWWVDEDGLMRAASRRDPDTSMGVLVAAEILVAGEGDTLDVPADPFDLRAFGLHKIQGGAHA
jgi:hypothetical protein